MLDLTDVDPTSSRRVRAASRFRDEEIDVAKTARSASLARLVLGETSVTALAKPFEMSMPAVSKHLKCWSAPASLLITARRSGVPAAWEAGPLKEAAIGIEEYRRFWEQSLNRLDAYLREVQEARTNSKSNGSGKKRSKTRS